MLVSVDLSGRPFHFIGIGGIGMSALAYVLLKRQLPVSGSDVRSNRITQHLQELGAQFFGQQEAANLTTLMAEFVSPSVLSKHPDHLNGAEVIPLPDTSAPLLPQVVCSTAIHLTNPEYQAALELGCPIYHRSDILAALIKESARSIAVAGTHGKTTTSSLLGYVLLQGGLDPTIIVGGEVAAWQGNARVGHSPYLVAEADESDGSLVKFEPMMGVITNIELDHPDHYSSLEEVVGIFKTFGEHCETLALCLDCPTIRSQLLPALTDREILSYSLDPESGADYTVREVVYDARGTTAQVWERGKPLGTLQLQLLGTHNLSNALAVVAVGRKLGLDFEAITAATASFSGTRRRFECRGEVQGMCLVDDYAHHPSEIQVTLASARIQTQSAAGQPSLWQRVVAVFQPHRYSRAHTFLDEFSRSFSDADLVIATDIYSAGEADQGLVSGTQVAAAIAQHHPAVLYQPTLSQVQTYLQEQLRPGDLVIFLGAGDVNRIIPEILDHYQRSDLQAREVVLQ